MESENNTPENNITRAETPRVEEIVEESVEVTKPVAPEVPRDDVVFNDKPKGKKGGVVFGMVLLSLLAIGGIGFGIWAYLDGNTQKEQLNSQINTLRQQNSTLESQVSELQAMVAAFERDPSGVYEIVAPEWGEAEVSVVDGKFTITNKDGDVYMTDDEHEIVEIVSCDSGTEADKKPMTCIVTTPTGEATMVYDFDDHSLSYTENE